MNVQRFFSLPNGFKPLKLLFIILTMLLAASAPLNEPAKASLPGNWFFWLNIIIQFVFICVVIGLFLYDSEEFLTMGKEQWPVIEMAYSGLFVVFNIINMFLLASYHRQAKKGANSYVIAALTTFLLIIFNAMSGLMMYRIWRGFVRSGTSQNPTPNLQPGNLGSMHPGI